MRRVTIFLCVTAGCVGIVLNFLLIANPGYYSHDELGFGFHSQGLGNNKLTDIQWCSPTDIAVPQYRPLTFNLWLFLSYWFYGWPTLFHFVVLVVTLLCGALAAMVLYSFSKNKAQALVAFTVFSMMPTTAFTAGWVGTLGEYLWVTFGLLSFRAFLGSMAGADDARSPLEVTKLCGVGLLLFVFALASKETAVVIPPLMAVFWVFFGRDRGVIVGAVVTTLATVVYLALRYDQLLGKQVPQGYGVSLEARHIVESLLLYFAYPFTVASFASVSSPLLGIVMHIALVACLAVIFKWPKGLAYALAYFLPVIPVAITPQWSPHYLFGSGIAAAVAISAMGVRKQQAWRLIAVLFAACLLAHSLFVQWEYYNRGIIQSRFKDSLYTQLADYAHQHKTNEVPEVFISADRDAPSLDILRRLIHPDVVSVNELLIRGKLHPVEFAPLATSSERTLFLRFCKGGYLLKRPQFPLIDLGQELTMRNRDLEWCAKKGWSPAEHDGMWSDGLEATLAFRVASLPVQNLLLQLGITPFVTDGNHPLKLQLLLNDKPAGEWLLSDAGPRVLSCNLPGEELGSDGLICVVLRFAATRSLFELGRGRDLRRLGVKLHSLKVTNDDM